MSVRFSLGKLSKKGTRNAKGSFIIELVKRARRPDGLPDVTTMSDRETARRLMEIDGVGPWVAGEALVYHLGRADVMVSGDLTLRNMMNVRAALPSHPLREGRPSLSRAARASSLWLRGASSPPYWSAHFMGRPLASSRHLFSIALHLP